MKGLGMQGELKGRTAGGRLKRFRAKWNPVRVKKTRQIKNLEPRSVFIGTEMALGSKVVAALLMGTALGSITVMVPAPAQGQTAQQRTFAIRPQPLPSALTVFGQQTGLQVSVDAAAARGLTSPGATGTMTPAVALHRLLAGTGLSYRFTGASTVVIGRPDAQAGGANVAGAISLDTIDVQGASSSDPGKTEGTGSYTTSVSSFGKNQTLKELPQTVTVMTHQRIQEQGLTTIDNVMEYTPGITVQQEHAASSVFYSRGFPITNYQIDGNSPLYGKGYYENLNTSQLDLAMFDRVEVLRGSDALYGTSGEPGGAINLVRKKPTKQFQMNALAHGGSWNNYRGELDVSGPLTANGSVRGRLVGVYEDRNYFYDYGKSKKHLLYGIIEADVTDSTMLTFGANILHQDFGGFHPYGLPRYSNGADIGLPRNFNLAGPNESWLRDNNRQFVRIDQQLGEKWTLGVEASRTQSGNVRTGFRWLGAIDPITGTGLGGDYNNFNYDEKQETLDVVLKGSFNLLGREHKLTLGTNINRREGSNDLRIGKRINIPQTIFDFDPANYVFDGSYNLATAYKQKEMEKGVYGSLVAHIADPLKLILGGRLSWYKYDSIWNGLNPSSGAVTGTDIVSYEDNKIFTPYLGVVYDLTNQWSAYASFAETYRSQASYRNGPPPGTPLGPVSGRTYEVGVKGSLFNGRLNTNLALIISSATVKRCRIQPILRPRATWAATAAILATAASSARAWILRSAARSLIAGGFMLATRSTIMRTR
jgi:outer membrane receptor for ferric coprogen and ferric-rhodotorulic acid